MSNNKLINFLKNTVHLGMSDKLDFVQARRIRVINYLSLISVPAWVISGVVLLSYQLFSAALINFIGVISCILALILNNKEKYKYAYYSLFLGTFISVYIIALHYGRASGVHYLFISWMVISIFLFDKPKHSSPYFGISIISFLFFEYYFSHYQSLLENYTDIKPATSVIQFVVIIISFSIIKSVLEFFKYDTNFFQKSLTEKNELLEQQKEEISTQNELLEEKNSEIELQNNQLVTAFDEITASVNYASRIQKAILPPKNIVTDNLKGLFILNRPKDIVSGDFYWFYKNQTSLYIAVADCTGHGVPGAFMTAIGNTLLNQIIHENSEISPAEILTQLNSKLITTLNQSIRREKVNDGMDIAVCLIDKNSKTITYSGAKRPLFRYNSNGFEIYSPSRYSIGGNLNSDILFSNIKIEYTTSDRFYLFTDGFSDQFGGSNDKKLKLIAFKQLLRNIQQYRIKEQEKRLNDFLLSWKGHKTQTDDILIIGFEIE